MLDRRATSAWWEVERIELPAAKGRRLQRRDGTSRPYWHFPKSAARVRRRELAEGEGVEPSTFPLAQFSRLVAHR